MSNHVKFVIEGMEVIDGEKLKDIRPDKDGYYKMPLAVIGVPTRNRTYYHPKEFIDQITNPNSPFNIMLTDNCSYGEFGHPYTKDLQRIAIIDEKSVSHHIKKVETTRIVDGGTLIEGHIKPCGPYGKYLEESLQDKNRNTAFSLRSLCTENYNSSTGLIERSMKLLVTFDAVGSSGYKQSTKRYANGSESFNVSNRSISNESVNISIPLTRDDFYKEDGVTLACENKYITDGFLTDLFGAKAIVLTTTSVPIRGTYLRGNKIFIGEDGNRHSLVHAMLNKD